MWQHRVQFFDTDDFIVRRMADTGRAALREGGSAVLVSAGARLRRLGALLAGEGDGASPGSLVVADAQELLAGVMVDGVPEEARLGVLVAGMVGRASDGGRRHLTVYGDIADALRVAGGVSTALLLEDMWTRLACDHAFDLVCAYPMGVFPDDHGGAFAEVCRLHTHVEPVEGLAAAMDDPDRLHRAIAHLQQSANSLRGERARRSRADRLVRQQASRLRAMERSHAELKVLAATDALTGLGNRRALLDCLSHAFARARRRDSRVALLFVDLDDFKDFNDRHGHDAGDRLLGEVAKRLSACARTAETVYRFGGDEFTIVMEDASTADAAGLAQRIVAALAAGPQEAGITASVGFGLYPDDADTVSALLDSADRAMYRVKSLGKCGCSEAVAARRPAPSPAPGPVKGETAWLTVEAAAARLRLSRPHVLKLIAEGRLEHMALHDGDLPLVLSDEVDRLARELETG